MDDRIALQLYSVREEAARDYECAVRQVAEMGYKAVEPAGFPGTTPEAAYRLFQDLGLTVTSAHMPLPIGDAKQQILETMDAIGKPPLVCTQITRNDVKTIDTIRDLCDRVNLANQNARSHNLRFGIHNHWWEFEYIDGRLIHDMMLELLDPDVFLQIDTYWVKVAGLDPVNVLRKLGNRVPLLHVKDGPADKERPMTALGEGEIDIPAILQATDKDTEYYIVELDRCATQIMDAVRKSYTYLAGHLS